MSHHDFNQYIEQLTVELTIRNYSPDTLRHYKYHLNCFFEFINYSEFDLNEDKVRAYLFDIKANSERSLSYLNIAYSSIKFIFVYILKIDWSINAIPRPKSERKLPKFLSFDEVITLLQLTNNLKHRAILSTIYSAGLRVSELVNLKVTDIDSSNMQILVRQGKGRKDRYTILSQNNLLLLREYFRRYRPSSEYLFPNPNTNLPLSTRTIQQIFKEALFRANINRDLSTHCLRHSFATHLLLNGTDIYFIKHFLGHSSIETTSIYLHVLNRDLHAIKSPFDNYTKGDLL